MDLPQALASLQRRPSERTSQDVSGMSSWLGANCGFFAGMQQEVVQMLCTVLGHCVVQEGAYVIKQGQVGDSMYIVVEGYCSILKHQQQQADTSSTANDSKRSGTNGDPDFSTADSAISGQCASRRVTTEQQVQQFALATGAVAQMSGQAGSVGAMLARRQQSGLCRRSSSSSGDLSLPALGRQTTAESLLQQQRSEAVHLGWVSQGESIGGAALMNPSSLRPVSVVAGDGGVVLLVLDRVGWNKLLWQAQLQQGVTATVIQSVLAAACRPLLLTPPSKRSADDVETLAQLFSGLQAFQPLPAAVRLRLAKSCQSMSLPAGAVVYKEGQKGDAMYVLLSGACHMRAQPLKPPQPPAQEATPADQAATAPPVPATDTVRQSSSLAAPAAAWTLGSTTNSSARGCLLARRTTWEGAAFTAQEQARLEAVRAALEADRHQQTLNSKQPSAASASGSTSSTTAGSTGGKGVEKDALYWTAKYMHDAATAATATSSHQESYGGLAPLAAVFAAKWRQQMRKQQAEQKSQQQQEEQAAAADKAYAAMEELLGKAAAKAWKAARDGSIHNISQQSPAETVAETKPVLTTSDSCSEADAATTSVTQGVLDKRNSMQCSNSRALEAEYSLQHQQPSRISDGTEASAATTPRCSNPAAASAAAAGLLAAAAESSDPSESLKVQLAAFGVHDPADVGRRLMEEVAQRADLDGLLAHVAGILERKGLPRRLNRKGSRRVTREVNKRMAGGGSWRDHDTAQQQQAPDPLQAHPLQAVGTNLQPTRPKCPAVNFASDVLESEMGSGHKGSDVKDSKTSRTSCDDTRSEPDLEATGTSKSYEGWKSMESTDATSMFMSYDADLEEDPDIFGAKGFVGYSQAAEAACSAFSKKALKTVTMNPGTSTPLAPEALDAMYGPVIRILNPGEAFGELALLSRDATRTATVVVEPTGHLSGQAEESAAVKQQQTALQASEAGPGVVKCAAMLIRVSRRCYDACIRSLQVSALEDLLDFLSGLLPFQSLSRDLLTTLAVFVRPLQLSQGQLLAIAGDKVEGLIIIQEGEVNLLDAPISTLASTPGHAVSTGSASVSGAADTSLLLQSRPRRGTADEVLLHRQISSSNAGNVLSTTGSTQALHRQLSYISTQAVGPSVIGRLSGNGGGAASAAAMQVILPTAGSGVNPVALRKLSQSAAPLAVLGPGALLGENVLGYNADQDPLDTIAAARGYQARQAAMAAAAASQTHQATAVTTRPCKVLLLSSEALRRFGRRVRAPLTQMAADRRDFLKQRRTAVQEAKCSLAQMMLNMKQQINEGAASVMAAPGGSSSISGLAPRSSGDGILTASKSVSNSKDLPDHIGPVLPGSAASGGFAIVPGLTASSSSSTTSHSSGLCKAASLVSSSAGASLTTDAAAVYRPNRRDNKPCVSRWQQQQWQRNAFGDLLQSAPAAQQVTVLDIPRLRQVVPGTQAPCVSQLAAAARAFPIGPLCATAERSGAITAAPSVEDQVEAAAAPATYNCSADSCILHEPESLASSVVITPGSLKKKPSAKGLRALLVPQQQQQQQQWRSSEYSRPEPTACGLHVTVGAAATSAAAVAAAGAVVQ